MKTDIIEQNQYLRDVWNHISFGVISPVEYFNLKELSVCNLILILKFIEKHDVSYIKNLSIPKMIEEHNNLILELNTIYQLNILNNNQTSSKTYPTSVFDIINYTKTAIGKRHLKTILCKPFRDPNIMNNRYIITDIIEEITPLKNGMILDNIVDIEKLHRKMGLAQLNQFELVKLDDSYKYIIQLIEIIENSDLKKYISFENQYLIKFKEYIKKYNETFDLKKMSTLNFNSGKDALENYFNIGVIKELDEIQYKINDLEKKRELLRVSYDKLINTDKKGGEYVKLIYTEFEGYSFTCTKIRYQLLLQKLGTTSELKCGKMKQTNNAIKFVPEELEELSQKIMSNRDLLSTKITTNYKNTLLEYYREYHVLFEKLKELIEIIDVCYSNLKCKEKYNFTKPYIEVKEESYVEVVGLRHVIVESMGKKYISNDIILDNNTNGILCYGLNSSGKSTLLRSLGVATIMAQCGLFVAANSFRFSPFYTIISQVDLSDNIFAGKSSYINEMMGLKRILQCSGKNTLVLMDEATKGTESFSSTALVSSVILELIKTNTKFFFTTHLHEIPKVQEIIDLKEKLKICHLSVDIKGNNIIYERKLKDGQGSGLYGVEVAKSLLECPELIEKAFEIRNKLIGTEKKPIKKSVYNSKKIIEKCQICCSTKQLEVDHIIPQATTNDKGFLHDTRHKNHLSNLCTLCHNCHLQKTLGKITINGYVDSTNGVFLDWYEN